MPDDITGYIDLFRLIIEAVNSGRIKSRDVPGMSDEGVEALITQLQSEAQAEIDRGKALDQ